MQWWSKVHLKKLLHAAGYDLLVWCTQARHAHG
jgi:hypothetical protein